MKSLIYILFIVFGVSSFVFFNKNDTQIHGSQNKMVSMEDASTKNLNSIDKESKTLPLIIESSDQNLYNSENVEVISDFAYPSPPFQN